MLSNRVKRNISAVLLIIGIICTIARFFGVVDNPHAGRAWFELCAIVILTFGCLLSLVDYNRKAKADS